MWLFLSLALAAPDPLSAWSRSRPDPDPVPPLAEGYRFAGPALQELADRARERPGVVEVEILGTSHDNAPLVAFHITEPDVPITEEVLVVAGLHAMEWIGTEAALTWAHALIDRPPRGTRVTIVPLANPDGRARVEADLLADNTEAYRRGNQLLVDLNRDYTAQRSPRAIWRRVIPGRYTTSPAALSQPESQALDALTQRHDYGVVASLHAFGGYLYHPWAGRWSRPEDWPDYVATGRRMEQAQGSHAYRTRQLARWGFFFRAHGTELDHFHQGGAQSWLIEITRSGLTRPSDLKTPFRWYNPRRPEIHTRRVIAALDVLRHAPSSHRPPAVSMRSDGE